MRGKNVYIVQVRGEILIFIKMSSLQSSGRDTNNHLMGLLLFVQVVIIRETG